MAMDIQRGGAWKPARMCWYGDPKAGKTSTAAQAPSPIFLGTDDGCAKLPVDRLPIVGTWDEFIGQLEQVASETHEYKTLVVDTLNGVAQLCAEHVCKTQFGGKWNDPRSGFLAWGGSQGWAAASEEMKPMMALLDKCMARNMWVILISHTKVENVKNPLEQDYQRFAPDLDRRVWSRIAQWCDCILRVSYKLIVKDGKPVSDGQRVFHCSATVAEEAGCRVGYELPAVLPLSWESIESHIGQPDLTVVEELKALWSSMDEEQVTKAIKYLGTKDLTKAPTHKVRTLVNRLKENTDGQ